MPNHNKLKFKLFKYIYNLLIAGHPGREKNPKTTLIKVLLAKYI